jgi:hypothetical protein
MVFAPIAVATLILITLIHSNSKEKTPPKRTPEQLQSDELITTILPTITDQD